MGNNMTVIMFSGQGAQYTGMGRELFDHSQAARGVFEMAEKIRPGTMEQCFSGSEEELAKTINTQPCLYCVDLAAAAALKEAGVIADILAGFSLGELAALAFSGAATYEDGFRLVCKRAEFMQQSAQSANAQMVAVLKLSDDAVIALCNEFSNVYPANFNCPGQVAVAGLVDELGAFAARVKETGGRAIPLKTSGGFHSPFMEDASKLFVKELEQYEIIQRSIPVYSNMTAKTYEGDIKELLAKQLCSPVLWQAAVANMITAGAAAFIEAGPGKTLCGLVSRISDEVSVYNVEDVTSLEKTVKDCRARHP